MQNGNNFFYVALWPNCAWNYQNFVFFLPDSLPVEITVSRNCVHKRKYNFWCHESFITLEQFQVVLSSTLKNSTATILDHQKTNGSKFSFRSLINAVAMVWGVAVTRWYGVPVSVGRLSVRTVATDRFNVPLPGQKCSPQPGKTSDSDLGFGSVGVAQMVQTSKIGLF